MSVTSCAQLPRNVSFVKTSVWPTSRSCPSGEVWQQLFWQSQISTTARQLLPSYWALPVLMAIADTCSPPGTDKRMTMREWQLLWSLNTCFLTTPTCSAARSKIGVSFKVNYTSRGNKTQDFQNYINVGKENFSMLLGRVQGTFCENMSKTLTDRSFCQTCWSKLGYSLSVIGGPSVAGVCHPVL